MSYTKITVDNTTCFRRFHIAFDSEGKALTKVQANCPHCGIEIFTAANHPEVELVREENLVKTTSFSENRISRCAYKDKMSPS